MKTHVRFPFARCVLIRPLKSVAAVLFCMALLAPAAELSAATVEYDLTIARQEMNFTGQTVKAIAVNGQLPGPTLRFMEGDHVVRAGTSYMLTKNFSLFGQWHSRFGWGGGLRWLF